MSSKSDRGTKRPKVEETPAERTPVGDPIMLDCGCREQKFSDGTSDKFPCIPHAMQQMATSLLDAGNAMGYIGAALEQQEARNREMRRLNEQTNEGIDEGKIT